MNPVIVSAVWEDELSGEVIKSIISQKKIHIELYPVFVNSSKTPSGFGYIKKNLFNFYKSSNDNQRFLLVVDSDNLPCAPALLESWNVPLDNPHFILQVAVREIESWILADIENFLSYFQIPQGLLNKFPAIMDDIPDPKKFLIEIMNHSKNNQFKRFIIPAVGSSAKVGKAYNFYLIDFIKQKWKYKIAAEHSISLQRFIKKLDKISKPAKR